MTSYILRTIGILAHAVAFAVVACAACGEGPACASDFETWNEGRPAGWSAFWTREGGAGALNADGGVKHGGERSARVEHRGGQDWALNGEKPLVAKAGDIFEIRAWVKIEGAGRVEPCAAVVDGQGKTLRWSEGGAEVRGPCDWTLAEGRFIAGDRISRVQPRVIGYGAATVWIDDFEMRRTGNVADLQAADLPATLALSNAVLNVVFRTATGAFDVEDRRTGNTLRQDAVGARFVVRTARVRKGALRAELIDPISGAELRVSAAIEKDKPEFTVDTTGEGRLRSPLPYPHPFVTPTGTYLVVPMNEGISYPVDDPDIKPMRLIAYGGHGICMAFWGATDGQAGHMAIIETPDDASIRIDRREGRLCVAPEWDAQKGAFGYARRLRYVFFGEGGHVAICKRYRQHAKAAGLVKTLAEKREANPDVDLLIGAVNVWCWDKNPVPIARELKAAGIERILWSNRGSPESIAAMNAMGGILTGRYDIYQDLMDPDLIARGIIRGGSDVWTQAAWPKDIIIGSNGRWIGGWEVKGKDGVMHPCAVLCDARAVAYAMDRVPADLKDHPYRARFIDTTTASSWRECYSPDHPMTRSDSRKAKMRLLEYMSKDMKLVTGSETGHDASVPFLHYFEGMLSLGPYRVPDAGRRMQEIWTEVPERVAKFQLGHRYRLPLWELVYHDCTVAQWYWGDYNNKLPALWDKRDLFNALYGTPPMFMFERKLWEAEKARFVRSYAATCPVARAAGYAEMTEHRFLTPDRDVQQTRFANGVAVTVNFADAPRTVEEMGELPALSSRVEGLPK